MMVKTVLLILAALAALILGCGTEGGDSSSADERSVRGRLTDVQAASLLEIESITVETESGETYVLEAGNRIFSGFTPSHLREHMLQGNMVTVSYEEEGDKLILKDVLD
jgi:hypothetical protein